MNRMHIARTFIALSLSLTLGSAVAAPRVFQYEKIDEALTTGIRNGDIAAVISALKRGADPNAKDAEGNPALVDAALYANRLTMRMLLERGANPNAATPAGVTALHIAAGDPIRARMLVAAGADVNAKTKAGRTPLLVAARQAGAYPAVKLLIEKGADPKALDVVPSFGGGANATALMLASRGGDIRTVRLLVEKGVDVNAKDASGSTALIEAAWNNNLPVVEYLVEHGADPNAATTGILKGFSALTLAAALDRPAIAEYLIAHGANVNARDGMGYTPLTWASMSESRNPRIVNALVAAGAELNVKGAFDETPFTYAAKRGATQIVQALKQAGAEGDIPQPDPADFMITRATKPSHDPAAAVAKSVDALMKSGPVFFKNSGCFSCHNQTIPLQAAVIARAHGIAVDREAEQKQVKTVLSFLKPAEEVLLEGTDAFPDIPVSVAYAMEALAAESYPADSLTAAAVHNIAGQQHADGSWPSFAPRPPIEYGEIQVTAFAIRAMKLYGMPGRKNEFEKRIALARQWLLKAKATTTEDRIMKLYGLYWANATKADVMRAAYELINDQRPGGGWAQLPTLDSDAYATGKALTALYDTGALSARDPQYRLGVAFLLDTQHEDGTWVVKTRIFPFQPLKPSGFPHDRDQWISAAGTAWAAIAIANTVQPAQQFAMLR